MLSIAAAEKHPNEYTEGSKLDVEMRYHLVSGLSILKS